MQRCAMPVVLGLSLLAACDHAGDAERLQALERRVAALEARGSESVESTGASVDADVRSLERRVAALERQIHDLAQAGAAGPGGAAAGSGPGAPALSGRRERRMQLRALTAQYRERLATIRNEPDPAKRQEAVREALEWYREQRSQLLAEPLPPTP